MDVSNLVIRDYIDGDTTGEINSPDILVIPSIWDDIEEMRMNYNAELQAVVSANQWGFVYVRIKNNCGETLHNIYVTASFSSDSTDGSNRTNALQTVDGMACSVISCLEPGEWAITEKPFILNRAEGITNTIYARACVGNMVQFKITGRTLWKSSSGICYAAGYYLYEDSVPKGMQLLHGSYLRNIILENPVLDQFNFREYNNLSFM